MNNKYGHKHPPPIMIRAFISKAIQTYDERLIKLKLDEQIEAMDYALGVFPVNAGRIIDQAITDACDAFEKDGIMGKYKDE